MNTWLKTSNLELITELKMQIGNSLQWPIYIFNADGNTKLPVILSHRHSTTVSLETYPLYSLLKTRLIDYRYLV